MSSEAAVVVTQNILGCWVSMATGTWDGCGQVDCASGRDVCEGFGGGVVMKGMELPVGLTMTRGGEYQECSFGTRQVVYPEHEKIQALNCLQI